MPDGQESNKEIFHYFLENLWRCILRQLCAQRYAVIARLSTRAELTSILSCRLFELHKNGSEGWFEPLQTEIDTGRAEWDAIHAELRHIAPSTGAGFSKVAITCVGGSGAP